MEVLKMLKKVELMGPIVLLQINQKVQFGGVCNIFLKSKLLF